jgi:hypothetical protein
MDKLIENLKREFVDGKKLVIHNCGMCGYECGYSWFNGKLYYDTGCNCTYGAGGFEPREEESIRQFLEMNPEWIAKNLAAFA